MASVITLYDLADLSIGTPEVGAVNFNALHILLHAIIKHLNIQELQTEITEEGGGLYKPPAGQVQLPPADQQQGGEALYYHKLHSKMMAMERQLEALNALPSGLELMERTKTQPAATTTPVGEMWQMMQMKKKIEANEDGVSKAMDLLQDLLHEISTLRQSHGDVDNRLQKVIDCLEPNQQETRQEFETQARQIELQGGDQEVLDKLRKELKSVQQRMIDLEGKLTQYPRPELLNNMVGWEELRETLVKCPSTMDATTSQPGQVTSPSPPKMSSIKSTSSLTKSGLSPKPSGVSVPTHSDRPLSTSTMAEAVVAPGIPPQDSASLTHPGDPVPASDGPRTAFNTLVPTHPPGSPGMTVPAPPTEDASTCKPSFPTVPPITMSRTASVSQRFPDTVEALRTLGTLSEEYDLLRCRVETLERDWMTVRAQLGEPELLCNLQEKLDLLQREMPNVKEDKEKLDRLQRILDPVISQITGSDQGEEGSGQISIQLGYLSANIQDIEKALKELREKQEQGKISMEQSVASNSLHLQEQLDKLREVLQSMVSSSSTLLNMSLPLADGFTTPSLTPTPLSPVDGNLPQAVAPPLQADSFPSASFPLGVTLQDDGLPSTSIPSQASPPQHITASQAQLTCPACSIDVSEKVSQLVSRYEQLQELVTTYMSMQAEGKSQDKKEFMPQSQGGDLLGQIQNKMLQLQEECENLNKTTGSLIQEQQQKQRHIDILYQSLEKLEEKKADKEQLEIDECGQKANKEALERKVSRTQFDSTTEQLNNMLQDLLSRVTGQEQDWQRVLDKISIEMQSKLDRMELDPFRMQLEDRWKAIYSQLLERSPQYEADEVAGIRKQLLARFHCISCDRPVAVRVPGQPILTIPNIPPLPAHRSMRPYTVYELDQIRQHNRNLQSGTYQARFEAAQLEKSISHLRRIHARMRQEMERVQMHFGGSIRDILQAKCFTVGQHPRKYKHRTGADRSQEMSDYGYISNIRSCGGSHTMTFPYQRYSKLQSIVPSTPLENENMGSSPKAEIDIMGFDGHIYRGRTDIRFPAIAIKEAHLKSRGKLSQTSLKSISIHHGNPPPTRPPSANLSGRNHSVRTSQDRNDPQNRSLTQADLVTRREMLEIRMDLALKQQSADESVM